MKTKRRCLLVLALALLCTLTACAARPKLSEVEQGELVAWLKDRGVVLQPGVGDAVLREMLAELEEQPGHDGPILMSVGYPYYLYEELRAAVIDYYGLEPLKTEPAGAAVARQVKEDFENAIRTRTALLSHLTLDLPKGIAAGRYDLYYRFIDYGGYPLLDKDGTECGGVALYTSAVGQFDDDGTLQAVSLLQNHASLENFTPVDGAAPCVTAVFSEDVFDGETGEYAGTHEQWCALWCRPDAGPVYALFIDRDRMDYDAFFEIVTSAAFGDGAFEQTN